MEKILSCTLSDLIENGYVTEQQIRALIAKNEKSKKRSEKIARALIVKKNVTSKLEELLVNPGATVKHRTVWEAIGRDLYTRDEVLQALRSLRSEGILQNIRTSNNNFQVFWAYVAQPESPTFSTLDSVIGDNK